MFEVFEVATGETFCRTEFEFQAYVISQKMGRRYDFDRRGYDVWPDSNSASFIGVYS